ncbi:MAG TPA: hypothetical protein VD999_05895 [Vitreimonas sp.]|nr:hypothetical protein [Vitreimonas sp.]
MKFRWFWTILTTLTVVFVCAVYVLLRFHRYRTGDLDSVCDARPENASVDELRWNQGVYQFFSISNQGLVSQLSNQEEATVIIPGEVKTFRLVKATNQLVYVQGQKLWLSDNEGKNKSELLSIPGDKELVIHGLSEDDQTLLIGFQNSDLSQERDPYNDDLRVINLQKRQGQQRAGRFPEAINELGIIRIPYPVKSTSDDKKASIQLVGGSFQINNKELFYCGVVRGTLEASGPACYDHQWLPDNEHILLDLCGPVIVEPATGKIARLNRSWGVEWQMVK